MNGNPANTHANTLAYGGAAAGTTTVTSSWIDTLTMEAICFHALVGAIVSTGTLALTLEYSDDGSTLLGAVTGSTMNIGDAGGSKVYSLGINRPTHRYVRMKMARATANVTILGVLAQSGLEMQRPQNGTNALVLNSPAYT